MHPDFATISQKLAGFNDPSRYFEQWSGLAQEWLMTEYGPKRPEHMPSDTSDEDYEELYPPSTRALLGWRFDSEEDDRKPTDRQAQIAHLTAVAPGIVSFKAYREIGEDFDLFGLVEQTESEPCCFKIHMTNPGSVQMLHLVGRDPDNPASVYNEAVYASGYGYGWHTMITDDDWHAICTWLTLWLAVPDVANAG